MEKILKAKKVAVAMSGGVDSAITATLLLESGYEVFGITMQTQDEFSEKQDGCCSVSAVKEAQKVAKELGITLYVLKVAKEFEEKVIQYFIKDYLRGKTPNPCIACNKEMKFKLLLEKAKSLGADLLATGHYAKIDYDCDSKKYLLSKAKDNHKDQSYVLYNLTQEQLGQVLMPLGEYTKDEVRKIALEKNLCVAKKPESQDICFIPDGNYNLFLQKRAGNLIKPGHFLNIMGEKIGEHKGFPFYTIGQRRGLGFGFGKRMYVVELNPKTGDVILGENEDLMANSLEALENNFIPFSKLTEPLQVETKIRYNGKADIAFLYPEDEGKIRVAFEKPQRAITPGQAVVYYQKDLVIGGGIINKIL